MRHQIALAALTAIIACGGDSASTGGTATAPLPDFTKPTGLIAISPTTVSLTAIQPVRIAVRVLNVSGAGLPGVTVAFAAPHGSPSASSVTSDDLGNATATWTPSSAPAQDTITAAVPGTQFTVSFTVNVFGSMVAKIQPPGASVMP